jgi:predicted nucleic acid-binding protein
MSAEEVVYLDSSALVKLVVAEAESDALVAYLAERSERASSALARVEVPRAVRSHGPKAVTRARELLERISLLDVAAALDGDHLRSLDAIHIAAAQTVATRLATIVTYDRRMGDAAKALGLTVAAPA